MKIAPVNFTQRSNVRQINGELIKAGYWIAEIDGTFFMYERKRAQPPGKLFRVKAVRIEMFKCANDIINRHFREMKWIK